jgi:hypothetical protein
MYKGKSKVMLSLVLNYPPHHADEWGSGGIAPYILNLDTIMHKI